MITAARLFLILEFLLLCVALPTVIIVYRLAPFMFAFLWGAALYAFLVTSRSPGGRDFIHGMWGWGAVNAANLRLIIPRWLVACVGMTAVIYFYDPARMFGLAERLEWWAFPLLVVAYTAFSALPQEFIFCSFFFRRYSAFFTTTARMIIASAVVFAYAHVLFINWVAPILSLIAGLIFASTYAKTRSLALVTIEHGLYGGWLFIVGLGWYFYGGAVAGY
jgi:membrane protease YdiL (CAAX protease family)